MSQSPEFPLTVRFPDGDVEIYETVIEVEMDLEFFDTELLPVDEPITVTDRLGRRVSLKVEKLEMVRCELYQEVSPDGRPEK